MKYKLGAVISLFTLAAVLSVALLTKKTIKNTLVRLPSGESPKLSRTDDLQSSWFGSCHSDATKISKGMIDMGSLCLHKDGSPCPSEVMDVIWQENDLIRIAVAPKMGGAIVFFGKKGLDAQNGMKCLADDSFCKEQWIGNRPFDRGRQFQIALLDQDFHKVNPVRNVECNDVDFKGRTLLAGGCGWNPTQAGGWQGLAGMIKNANGQIENHLPGETGGCAVMPGQVVCSDGVQSSADRDNLNSAVLPAAMDGKIYVRSGHYLNYFYNNPPAAGDSAVLRTDIWSEQWYCLVGDSFQMQVQLHHDGNDWHWNFNHDPVGPGDALASVWLQGAVEQYLYSDQKMSFIVADSSLQVDPNGLGGDRFMHVSSDRWFGFKRAKVPLALYVGLEIPHQSLDEDFGPVTQVDYWGARGDPDREYPVTEGDFYQQLNIRPQSTYLWSVKAWFKSPEVSNNQSTSKE